MDISFYVEFFSALCGAFAYLIVGSKLEMNEGGGAVWFSIVILSVLVTIFGVQFLVYSILHNPMEVVDFITREIIEVTYSEIKAIAYAAIIVKIKQLRE